MERTLCIIKPDATRRNLTSLINKIIEEIEDTECMAEMCKQKPHLVLKETPRFEPIARRSTGVKF